MELFPYQKEAVSFIRANKKVYLAMDMGTGKTLTALTGASEVAKKNILVIAEKNEIVNSENFRKEVETHFVKMAYVNLREQSIPPAGGDIRYVCGINPDGLAKHDIRKIVEHFDVVIADEATMAKTTTTARFKAVYKVCKAMDYVILLSGTPMMNGASEMYAPLMLLEHSLAGDHKKKSKEAFEAIFAGGHRRKVRNTGIFFQDYAWWAKGANHLRELRYLLRDRFFFVRKEDTGVFKTKTRLVIPVEMTPEWLIEYESAWNDYYDECGVRNLSEVKMDNIRELQNLIENGKMYQVNSKWKARTVALHVANRAEKDRRIVIFCLYLATEEVIKEELTRHGVAWSTFEDIKAWKTGDEPVLIGRIKAHGKGGNVPEASIVVMVDMDFVPANNMQAENRIDRPEQKRDMKILYYVTEGEDVIDTHIRTINQDKKKKIDEFMRPFTAEELEAMPASLDIIRKKYGRHFNQLGYETRQKL